MNIRTLCLAILYDRDVTGYEIRKACTEGDYAYFVEASYGSIYPALARLEGEGLVVGKVEAQDGKPSKKTYSITEAGRQEFRSSLFENIGEDVYRSEFLLFAHFAPILPASLVETRLTERLAALEKQIEDLERLKADPVGAEDLWVINYGMQCLQVARSYIETHMHELVGLARPDGDAALAAE